MGNYFRLVSLMGYFSPKKEQLRRQRKTSMEQGVPISGLDPVLDSHLSSAARSPARSSPLSALSLSSRTTALSGRFHARSTVTTSRFSPRTREKEICCLPFVFSDSFTMTSFLVAEKCHSLSLFLPFFFLSREIKYIGYVQSPFRNHF